MKRITTLFAVFLAAFFSTQLYASVNPATAWWNNETFESYDVLTDMNPEVEGVKEWSNATFSYLIQNFKMISNETSVAGKVFGISLGGGENFDQSSGVGASTSKIFENALSGYVYVKLSAFACTQGTYYQLKNTNGDIVFQFGGNNDKNNSVFFRVGNEDNVSPVFQGLGGRYRWADFEFVLDLVNKKVVKAVASSDKKTSTPLTNVDLLAGGDLKSMNVWMGGWPAAAMDNVTIGELAANSLKDLAGPASVQALFGKNTVANYSVVSYAAVMGLEIVLPGDVVWTVSDFGGLNAEDQAKITLAADESDTRKAVLTIGEISADATIKLKAQIGDASVEYDVALKKPTAEALKTTLLELITTATASKDAVTADNPFIVSIKGTLTTSIDAAQAVYDDGGATMEAVGTAITSLQAAETAFNEAMEPFNGFVAYIETVQAAHDVETRDAAFFVATKATLASALETANAALATVESGEAIATSQTALEAALAQFNADIPVYGTLDAEITSVSAKLDVFKLREGDTNFLMYPTATVATLEEAVEAARTALATLTTVDELNAANATLSAALKSFTDAPRVSDGGRTYRIYTYGVVNGDGNNDKKILYAGETHLQYMVGLTGPNDKWLIDEVVTDSFTLYNKGLELYLAADLTFSETPAKFVFVENKSGGQVIEKDGYFLYAIRNSNNRTLEVGDPAADALKISSTVTFERFRMCFHFEVVENEEAREALLEEINTATALKDDAADNPYITALKETLAAAIAVAQPVYDNEDATIEDLNTATGTLQAAETAFSEALAPYNEFVAYIETVQAAHDAEIRDAAFFVATKATLASALETANAALATVESVEAITTAQAALEAALTQFNAGIPAYVALGAEITSVSAKLEEFKSREGETKFLMYTPDEIAKLQEAINAANTALSTLETVEGLNTAQATLAAALDNFVAAPRISTGGGHFKIYTYGVPNGDGNNDKKVVYGEGTTLKYVVASNNPANDLWQINEVSTNVFTLYNEGLQLYLAANATLSDTPAKFTIVDNRSKDKVIEKDGYFLYAITNSSNKVLELNTDGVFKVSNTIFERFRSCFHFEPHNVGICPESNENSSVKAYFSGDMLVMEGAEGSAYAVYTTTGSVIAAGVVSSDAVNLALPTGLYLVKVGGSVFKVIK